MPRLIPVPVGPDVPEVTVAVGDVLSFAASGGQVLAGDAVEVIGVFGAGAVAPGGLVLTPAGPPNQLLVRAVGAGRSSLRLTTGGFGARATHDVAVVVSDPR